MSITLLFICRRSINLTQARPLLLHPFNLSSRIFFVELSTLKPKYGSLKPSTSFENPFREPTDEKSRRLKLQENIRFREKFQLENDYELIYSLPRQRLYGLMHLLCTCASISMLVFVIMQLHREMLDMEPILTNIDQQIPTWTIYSTAAIVGTAFGFVLILISRMPIRLYYSSVRRSYALFYYPVIGVLRQKKILFRDDQYKLIRQKLDSIESPERSIKIRIQLGQGLLRMKYSFYLIENLFRSRRDIYRIQMKKIDNNEIKSNEQQNETDIWETVMEKKDQQPSQKRTFIAKKKTLRSFLRTEKCRTLHPICEVLYYFISNSIIDFFIINTFLLLQLISIFNLKIIAYITITILWCKLVNYLFFLLPCLASSYIILASIDRFCASSLNEKLQKLNQLKLSRILALIVILFWLLFSLHIPTSYDLIQSTPTKCSPQLNLAFVFVFLDGFFFAIFNWVIVPLFLIIFGLLILRDIKFIHQRTYPQQLAIHLSSNRYNQHLIKMLLFQVSLTIILNIPYIVLYLYGIYNAVPQQLLPLLMYKIFSYIGRWFWFMNYCKTFRNILKRKIIYLIRQSKDIILLRTRTIN